jgi:hypothetical protein
MKCSKSSKNVTWEIDREFIEDIIDSLNTDKHEIAGSILFKDVNCKGNICDKKFLQDYRVKGEKSSVRTPDGIINYHTHPLQCYIDEDTEYGWPSGEDMAINMSYAKRGTLVHIVFTLEGSYVIKVNLLLDSKTVDILEKILKATHIYRLKNQTTQLKNFIRQFGIHGRTTVQIWLKLINSLSAKKIYTLYNRIFKKNLEIPEDTRKIFEVVKTPLNEPLTFSANFISGECHKNNFSNYGNFD